MDLQDILVHVPFFNDVPQRLQLTELPDQDYKICHKNTFYQQILEDPPYQFSFQQVKATPKQTDNDCSSQTLKLQKKDLSNVKMKNQTKNIPKNYGKGIISFVQKHQKKLQPIVQSMGIEFRQFLSFLRQQKKSINTIADLRRLWTNCTLGKCLRIISNLFFRKYALTYIFNSRISSYGSHIKYRSSLWQALKQPHNFNHIKQY